METFYSRPYGNDKNKNRIDIDMEGYRIEPVGTTDVALCESQKLLQLVFEKRVTKFSFDYIKWLYVENPVGNVVGFNAYFGKELVAHYVAMPIYMVVNGERTLGLLSLNTATHPEHRGKKLFSVLAEKTYNFAAEKGFKFVIGVANANSTHGFVKNLHFQLIGPLIFKIGVGTKIFPRREYSYTRYWDKDIMNWRMKNPSMTYYKNDSLIVSPIMVGFKKLVCSHGAELTMRPRLHLRPFNLYIGYGADLSKGFYVNTPKFIKHSPFNLIFRDLTNGLLPEINKSNILFELIDFDVA